jgi:hypothetical protein
MKNTIKNTKLIALAIAGLSLTFFTACDKDDDHDHNDTSDKTAPAVTLTSPTSMQIFYSGDTVWIKGTVTDQSLHEMVVSIKKKSDDAVLFTTTPTVHDLTTYNLNTFWKCAVSGHTDAYLEIVVEDHSSNKTTHKTDIHFMP